MKKLLSPLFLFLFVGDCLCAITNVSVSPLHNRVNIVYTSPDTSACSLELSESASYSPVVNDLNTGLFSGSNIDTRNGAIKNRTRVNFIAGTPKYEKALDGKVYSRALQTDTEYFYRITCGTDTANGRFRTIPIPLGNSYNCVPQTMAGEWGNNAQSSINLNISSNVYVDACSGIGYRVMNSTNSPRGYARGDYGALGVSSVQDLLSAWTTPSNITDTVLRTTTTASGQSNSINAYFVPQGDQSLTGLATNHIVTGVLFSISGLGTTATASERQMSVCISTDGGNNCATRTHTFVLSQTTPATAQIPQTLSSDINFSTWTLPGAKPIGTDMLMYRQMGVSTLGSNISITSFYLGAGFTDISTGAIVSLSGCSGSGNGDYTIQTVVHFSSITVTPSPGTNASCTAKIYPASFKIWKTNSGGSIALNNVRFNYTFEGKPATNYAGFYKFCSNTPAYDSFGEKGWACSTFSNDSGQSRLYWINDRTGDSRFISRTTTSGMSGLDANDKPVLDEGLYSISPDPLDPRVWYSVIATGPGLIYRGIAKCTYNATVGGWQAWGGNPTDVDNPNWSCDNIAKKSLNQDLVTQITTVNPSCSGMAANIITIGVNNNGIMGIQYSGQDLPGCVVFFSTRTSTVSNAFTTWTNYPIRWTAIHSEPEPVGGSYWALGQKPMASNWSVSISSITGIAGTTAMNNTYFDARTCETMGVTDSRWIAFGATGNNCVEVWVSTDDVKYCGAPSWMITKWPHPNPSLSSTCAQMSTVQEGDFAYDSSATPFEKFVVAKRSGTRLVLSRNNQSFGLGAIDGLGIASHSNGWALSMIPANSIHAVSGGVVVFDEVTGPIGYDNETSLWAGHHDTVDRSGISTHIVSGYKIRTASYQSQANQPTTYQSNSYNPVFGGGTYYGTGATIQSHPTIKNDLSSGQDSNTAYDGKPWGGPGGSTSGMDVFDHTFTRISGNIVKVSTPTWAGLSLKTTFDPKITPYAMWAGRYAVDNISAPGSLLYSTDVWKGCRVYQPGECYAGSSIGEVYIALDKPYLDSGKCNMGTMESNTPCWAPLAAGVGTSTQFSVDRNDYDGVYWRSLGFFGLGLGWTNNFYQPRPTPSGKHIITSGNFDGYRWYHLLAKMPEYRADTIKRNNFISVPVSIGGGAGINARVEFGYSENDRGQLSSGSVPRCSAYDSPCYAGGSANPYNYSFEATQRTSCTSSCTINLPAVPSRVLYYRVLRFNGSTESADPIQAVSVP